MKQVQDLECKAATNFWGYGSISMLYNNDHFTVIQLSVFSITEMSKDATCTKCKPHSLLGGRKDELKPHFLGQGVWSVSKLLPIPISSFKGRSDVVHGKLKAEKGYSNLSSWHFESSWVTGPRSWSNWITRWLKSSSCEMT